MLGFCMKIEAKIQKWGNGLALRVGGAMRDIPRFYDGSVVNVEISEEGFVVTKQETKPLFPFTESELLENLTPNSAHADLLAQPTRDECDY